MWNGVGTRTYRDSEREREKKRKRKTQLYSVLMAYRYACGLDCGLAEYVYDRMLWGGFVFVSGRIGRWMERCSGHGGWWREVGERIAIC